MTGLSLRGALLVPFGLGLLGFVEPYTIGSTLIFVKHIEGRDAGGKLAEVGLFAVTRGLFIGALGTLAVRSDRRSSAFKRQPGSRLARSISGSASSMSPVGPAG